MKIEKITLAGFRGTKENFELDLKGKSVLIYGDNGTGKSSIADAVEYFYSGKVGHLSNGEIKPLEGALRNAGITIDKKSEIGIKFSIANLDNVKTIEKSGDKFKNAYSNTNDDFNEYLEEAKGENLWLRYQFLREFVDSTKSEKLNHLSGIIGYAEINRKRQVLKKVYNHTKRELKNQNYEGQISREKETLINKLGANPNQEADLFETLNTKLNIILEEEKITSFKSIDLALGKLKKLDNTKTLQKLDFYNKVNKSAKTLSEEVETLRTLYKEFYDEFMYVKEDLDSIKSSLFNELLLAGQRVVNSNEYKNENCPLCLQEINIEALKAELIDRIKKNEIVGKKLKKFKSTKVKLDSFNDIRIAKLTGFLSNEGLDQYENVKNNFNDLVAKYKKIKINSEIEITSGNEVETWSNLNLSFADFGFREKLESEIEVIEKEISKNDSVQKYSDISASKDAFLKIKVYEKEESIFQNQIKSLEIIYDSFVKKQQEELEKFIQKFSGKINEYYQFLNPKAPFQELKIFTIVKDDELDGISIKYKYEGQWVNPPQKYFSESQLNCFGLAFFFASIEAFNKKNKFVLLDDVISSFDSRHRKRFAELIFERFSSYQIILLTHEYEWFKNLVAPKAKGRGWMVKELKWNLQDGTKIQEAPKDLGPAISKAIAEGNIESVGNDIRKYLERTLKYVAYNIGAKLAFKYNSDNEHRMSTELMNAFKSTIKKAKSNLKEKSELFDRLSDDAVFSNNYSHDNPMSSRQGDLESLWSDVLEFEKLIYCSGEECKNRCISLKYFDNVNNKIRCSCGSINYEWKA